MLEEKNDNLLEADGSVDNESQEVTIADNKETPVETEIVQEALNDYYKKLGI